MTHELVPGDTPEAELIDEGNQDFGGNMWLSTMNAEGG